MFIILDLQFGHHFLLPHKGDKTKIAFWGTNQNGYDCLYHLKFPPFGLKNARTKLQSDGSSIWMFWILPNVYIYDIRKKYKL
jgi:hypothetical protein